MNKKRKKNTTELIFSAFLCSASIVCVYLFTSLIKDSSGLPQTIQNLILYAMFVMFGMILFYATRIGDGKQIKRFSPATLIIMDIPALYVILASLMETLPYSQQISSCTEMVIFAAVILGYGIPYTFVSGYELDTSENEEDNEDKDIQHDEKSDSIDMTEDTQVESESDRMDISSDEENAIPADETDEEGNNEDNDIDIED